MEQAQLFWVMPAPMLRNLVMGGLETASNDPDLIKAADFMTFCLDNLNQSILASRLSVNCAPCFVDAQKVKKKIENKEENPS